MKNTYLFLIMGLVFIFSQYSYSQNVDLNEASTIAENWIQIIIDRQGHWGKSPIATIKSGTDLKEGDRKIGYLFAIEPKGFIALSPRKELSPIKAYSEYSNIDQGQDEGLISLIRTCMVGAIIEIEKIMGTNKTINSENIVNQLNRDYRGLWDYIDNYQPGAARQKDYVESGWLLSTYWHQHFPYNHFCPDLGCGSENALVGCVATAGAQIMKYWNWPAHGNGSPYADLYDWPNMPRDSASTTTTVQRDAVAELNYEVALAVDMDFGCDESSAFTSDMVGVFENNFRYNTDCQYLYRSDYTTSVWYNFIRGQLNKNRPMEYRVTNHAIVVDGWWETGVPEIKYVHVNYGWGPGSTGWLDIDSLYLGDVNEEGMVYDIYPALALGASFFGTYSLPAFPYRYFDRDAVATSAAFAAGHYLQALPDITITGITDLTFYGTTSLNTRIFTEGDVYKGVILKGGSLKLKNGGSMTLRK